MKNPSLFILGAPKCGTTTVTHWLSQHPRVFMAPRKEPHRFYSPYGPTMGEHEYERLFAGASERHAVVGEASVWYFFSGTAVPAILEYATDARFVVCLRNPVAATVSLHAQKIATGHEAFTDFHQAWLASAARQTGKHEGIRALPEGDPAHMAYKHTARFGTQLEALFSQVDRRRVCVLLLEDLADRPTEAWLRLQDFLSLEHHDLRAFETKNPATTPRSSLLQSLLLKVGTLRDRLGLPAGTGLLGPLSRMNTLEKPYPAPSEHVLNEVYDHYRNEINKVETLLGRSLPAWHSLGGRVFDDSSSLAKRAVERG